MAATAIIHRRGKPLLAKEFMHCRNQGDRASTQRVIELDMASEMGGVVKDRTFKHWSVEHLFEAQRLRAELMHLVEPLA